jgi:hypothetical protein
MDMPSIGPSARKRLVEAAERSGIGQEIQPQTSQGTRPSLGSITVATYGNSRFADS